MALIDQLLRSMVEQGGSDLHLTIGQPAKIRLHGKLEILTESPIVAELMEQMLKEICSEKRWEHFIEQNDLDFAYEIEGLARFRTNYLRNFYGMAAVLRVIPTKILTMEDLKLPKILKDIINYNNGLILVTGPTGSGKSTTMAAMLDYINKNYSKNIITIEDPIEFVHINQKSTIIHNEIGIHSHSFNDALKSAMKSDPDIILLGEMRDLETIKLALNCAAMGILVLATLHTNNAPKTIDRIIDAFPSEEQPQVRTMLSECIKGIVSQLLCKSVNQDGRYAVHEILFRTEGLPNTIREGQISNIRTIIESNTSIGMQSMDQSLMGLVKEKKITYEEAFFKAQDKKAFKDLAEKK
ncbi:MAG TPA: PilT/PilU family type 4a pilus ATPase [Victivallales bacterium]|nr:PilT/PilU family type 4a pilus ATPase [Victivallales bacterium]